MSIATDCKSATVTYGMNAGTATIIYEIGGNGWSLGPFTRTVKVNKGTPNVSPPTDVKGTYGDTLSSVQLPEVSGGTWAWNNPNDPVGMVGERNHTATFTSNDTNYNPKEIVVPVTVNQKPVTITGVTTADRRR